MTKTGRERGSALIAVLFLVGVMAVAGAAYMARTTLMKGIVGGLYKKSQSNQSAEGGLDLAQLQIMKQAQKIVTDTLNEYYDDMLDDRTFEIPDAAALLDSIRLSQGEVSFTFPTHANGQPNPEILTDGRNYVYAYHVDMNEQQGDNRLRLTSDGMVTLYLPTPESFGDFAIFMDAASLPPLSSAFSMRSSCTNDGYVFRGGTIDKLEQFGRIHSNSRAYTNAHCQFVPGVPEASYFSFESTIHSGNPGPLDDNLFHAKVTSSFDKYLHRSVRYSINESITFEGPISDVAGSPAELPVPIASFSLFKFEEGFQVRSEIELPTKSDRQERAALLDDGAPIPVSASERASALGSGPIADGIYLPHNSSDKLTAGIYIKGCVEKIHLERDSGNRQLYQIQMCGGGSPQDLVVNYGSNTTHFGGTTYDGIPNGSLTVDGQLKKLGGPLNQPALHAETAVTITSKVGNIVLDSDLIYEKVPGTPNSDPLDPMNMKARNILGVVAMGGGVATCDSNCPGFGGTNDFTFHGYFMGADGAVAPLWNGNTSNIQQLGRCDILGGAVGKYFGEGKTPTVAGVWNGCKYGVGPKPDPRVGYLPPYYPAFGTPPQVELFEIQRNVAEAGEPAIAYAP